MRNIDKDTIMCVSLAARPSHFGTRFHNFLYEAMDLNYVYKSFAVEDLNGAIQGIRAFKIRGSAVTMPFKEKVLDLLDEVSADAREIGAVNTVVNDQGFLRGFNTDALAVEKSIAAVDSKISVALFGAGGMAKAIAHSLSKRKFKNVIVIARNETTGKALAARYGWKWFARWPAGEGEGEGEAAPGVKSAPIQMLINATPIGMAPDPEGALPFTEKLIDEARIIFESVAHPPETSLVKLAQKKNKRVISGFEIVCAQAVEQFKLYTGKIPTAEQIVKASRFALTGQK
jgi:shikimate dehydrogenase